MNIEYWGKGLEPCPLIRISSDTEADFVRLNDSIKALKGSRIDRSKVVLTSGLSTHQRCALVVTRASHMSSLTGPSDNSFTLSLTASDLVRFSENIDLLTAQDGFFWVGVNSHTNILICRYEHGYT